MIEVWLSHIHGMWSLESYMAAAANTGQSGSLGFNKGLGLKGLRAKSLGVGA